MTVKPSVLHGDLWSGNMGACVCVCVFCGFEYVSHSALFSLLGGEEAWDASSLQVMSCKRALLLVALLRNMTCNWARSKPRSRCAPQGSDQNPCGWCILGAFIFQIFSKSDAPHVRSQIARLHQTSSVRSHICFQRRLGYTFDPTSDFSLPK